jgi:hypothetical protein
MRFFKLIYDFFLNTIRFYSFEFNLFFSRFTCTTAVVNIPTAVVNIYNRERDWSILNVIILPQLGLITRLNVIARSSVVAQ